MGRVHSGKARPSFHAHVCACFFMQKKARNSPSVCRRRRDHRPGGLGRADAAGRRAAATRAGQRRAHGQRLFVCECVCEVLRARTLQKGGAAKPANASQCNAHTFLLPPTPPRPHTSLRNAPVPLSQAGPCPVQPFPRVKPGPSPGHRRPSRAERGGKRKKMESRSHLRRGGERRWRDGKVVVLHFGRPMHQERAGVPGYTMNRESQVQKNTRAHHPRPPSPPLPLSSLSAARPSPPLP